MAAHICVTVSGPALSFLIYENVKSYCDQEGFLIGEIISHVTDTISDSQIRGEKTETIISVNSLMPIPHSMLFYNGIGKVHEEKLKNFLKDKAKEVIGWYSFRRNSSLVPHLRDRLLHKELSAAVPHVSPEHFTMCLLNTSISNGGSTHVFNHKFLRYRHSKFEALPMQIHNLGETQPEYKLVPSTTCLSDSFNSIIRSLKGNHDNGSSDATLVCQIQTALQEHLRVLINEVAASEINVAELEKEVEVLRQQTGPMSNEVLLPQLLREEPNNIKDLSVSSENELLEPPTLTPVKALKPTSSPLIDSTSSNHLVKRKDDGSGDAPQSSDRFSYVNDLKTQMMNQSPPSPTTPPSLTIERPNSPVAATSKRSSERGRGTGRGGNRGARRSQQPMSQKQSSSPQTQSQRQQSPMKASGDGPDTVTTRRSGSAGASPVRGSAQTNTPRGPKRCGYAQAVKRSPVPTEAVKPLTRSQANNTNSQEY